MGNLADHKRLRKEQGLHEVDPGGGKFTKEELDYIPFLGDNPTDEKPAVYTGKFKLPDGTIELEAKRSGGRIRMTCEAIDEHNRAIFECVERFIEAIYTDTARKITSPTEEKIYEIEKDNLVLEAELKKAKQALDIIKKAI